MKKTFLIVAASVVMVAMCASLWAADTGAGTGVTLTVQLYDRATPGYLADNNFQTKYVQEGIKKAYGFNVKFITVPRFQDVPRVNVLMAAGKAADVSFLYDLGTVSNYIKSRGLQDLTSLLDQYGKELKAYLTDDVLAYGNFDGKQWAVPAKRTNIAKHCAFVRKDWLDKLGMKAPTTTQGFIDMLKAIKEKNPGKVAGVWGPWGIATDPNNIDWNVQLFLDSFKKPMSAEDAACYIRFANPGYKDGYRVINQMYNDGLIDQNFPVDNTGNLLSTIVMQNKIAAYMGNWDYPYRTVPGWIIELRKTNPDANFIPIDPFVNSVGKHDKSLYSPAGMYIFVPRFSKHAKEAVQYLNWMSGLDVLKFLQNGVKGQQYANETASGIPYGFYDNSALPDALKFNQTDLPIISNGKEYGSLDVNAEAVARSYTGFEDLVKQAFKISMTDATVPFHFDAIIAAEGKYTGQMNQKGSELFAKSITCPVADFDKTWDGLYKEWLDSGAQKIMDERRIAYRAQMAARTKK